MIEGGDLSIISSYFLIFKLYFEMCKKHKMEEKMNDLVRRRLSGKHSS